MRATVDDSAQLVQQRKVKGLWQDVSSAFCLVLPGFVGRGRAGSHGSGLADRLAGVPG